MSSNCEYVREHYGVPACIGRLVVAYGKPGTIVKDCGHYIGITLDEDPKRRVGRYHPVDGIVYGEMAKKVPRAPRPTNYDRYLKEEYPDSFHEYLGINMPRREQRVHEGQLQYRMYRLRQWWDYSGCGRDVQGEWSPTAALAKASYKSELKKSREE